MPEQQTDESLHLTGEERNQNPIIASTFSKLSDRQKKILGAAAGAVALSVLAFATVATFGLAAPVGVGIMAGFAALGGVGGFQSPKIALKSLSVSTAVGAIAGGIAGGLAGAALGAALGSAFDAAVRMYTKERWSTNRALFHSARYIGAKLGFAEPNRSIQPETTIEHSSSNLQNLPEQPHTNRTKDIAKQAKEVINQRSSRSKNKEKTQKRARSAPATSRTNKTTSRGQ